MKARLLSDIHFEFHRDGGEEFISRQNFDGVDVLILAGDIGVFSYGLKEQLIKLCEKAGERPVIYVAGNHDHYNQSMAQIDSLRKKWRVQKDYPKNLQWLENEIFVYQDQRFLGTTLWFPQTSEALRLRGHLTDYDLIPDLVNTVDVRNRSAVRFLDDQMRRGDVIVTHHLPTHLVVQPEYRNSLLNCFYVTELHVLFRSSKPKFWFHGHSHAAHKDLIGDTTIMANPLGYPNQQTGFIDDLVIDLD